MVYMTISRNGIWCKSTWIVDLKPQIKSEGVFFKRTLWRKHLASDNWIQIFIRRPNSKLIYNLFKHICAESIIYDLTLNPRMEKMTIEAKIEVPQLMVDTRIASRLQLLWTSL